MSKHLDRGRDVALFSGDILLELGVFIQVAYLGLDFCRMGTTSVCGAFCSTFFAF